MNKEIGNAITRVKSNLSTCLLRQFTSMRMSVGFRGITIRNIFIQIEHGVFEGKARHQKTR